MPDAFQHLLQMANAGFLSKQCQGNLDAERVAEDRKDFTCLFSKDFIDIFNLLNIIILISKKQGQKAV